jgi:DNA-binding NarL/FixJ family response regulator
MSDRSITIDAMRHRLARIRVLIADLPKMLADIVTSLLDAQPDIEIVTGPVAGEPLPALVRNARPDLVIMGLSGTELTPTGRQLFDADPRIRVLGITGNGRRAFVYQLCPQPFALGELSPDGLVETVRAVMEPEFAEEGPREIESP